MWPLVVTGWNKKNIVLPRWEDLCNDTVSLCFPQIEPTEKQDAFDSDPVPGGGGGEGLQKESKFVQNCDFSNLPPKMMLMKKKKKVMAEVIIILQGIF